jgi:Galactose oxidase, central domain
MMAMMTLGTKLILPLLLAIALPASVPALADQAIRVVDLDPDPAPAPTEVAAARQALREGHIVRIIGGTADHLRRLLQVAGVDIQAHEQRTSTPNASESSASVGPETPLHLQVVATRATPGGALHQYYGFASAEAPQGAWEPAFDQWASRARGGSALQLPPPPAEAWTELQQVTHTTSDSQSNTTQHTATVFRLNDINADNDWYMVLQEPEVEPNWSPNPPGALPCTLAFGWWTNQRVFTISTAPEFLLFDHGPTGTITTSNAGFTIGGLLNVTGPGVSATYTASWSQPSVTTIDQSNLNAAVAQWEENFAGPPAVGCPPETSIETFYSNQGAIFQVPEGTTAFTLTVAGTIQFKYDRGFNFDLWNDTFSYPLPIQPPVFGVNPPTVAVAPGQAGGVRVTAAIPGSAQGLPWVVTNIPAWLTVSQTEGSGSADLTLTVAPDTPAGTVASLNVDTDPAFAAPAVESGPLTVQVTVGSPPASGVLIAGGYSVTGEPVGTAALYDLDTGQFTGVGPMVSPRAAHTATLLPSGQVLLAGGFTGAEASVVLASAELFDPTTGRFSAVGGQPGCPGPPGCLVVRRAQHTATLLPSGLVLLAGGTDSASGSPLAAAELYDPRRRTFTATGRMTTARVRHAATLMANGEVLLAGGVDSSGATSATAEVYNPTTGTFTPTANAMASSRADFPAVPLSTGLVLIPGGANGPGEFQTTAIFWVELYDPTSRGFVNGLYSMNVARAGHAGTVLPDSPSQVLITGSVPLSPPSAELYNPPTQQFALTSSGACPGSPGCPLSVRTFHTATRVPSGSVLLVGGVDNNGVATGTTALYAPSANTFTAGPELTPVFYHTATLIPAQLPPGPRCPWWPLCP